MELLLKTDLPRPLQPQLPPGAGVMLLGSCFAQHMGRRLVTAGWPVAVNPTGVLYNPASVALVLEQLVRLARGERVEVGEAVFQGRDGLWHSWWGSGELSATSREACEGQTLEALRRAARRLPQLRLLVVTWGTAHVYRLQPEGCIVANCHREPGARFVEEELSIEAITAQWRAVLSQLWVVAPEVQVVMTVSPYRYAKYGLHGSQLTKARLLLAADTLVQEHAGRMAYFPAYEMVTDELRDYRFYEPDLCHPSPQAVDYVWERFAPWAFAPDALRCLIDCLAVARDLGHRPLHPDAPEAAAWRNRLAERVQALRQRYGPWVMAGE